MNEDRLAEYIERRNRQIAAYYHVVRQFTGYAYVRRIRPGDTPDDHPFDNKLPWFVFPARDAKCAIRFSTHARAIAWARKQVMQ